MTRMTGPDCAVMCNLINTHIQYTHAHTHGLRGYLKCYIYTHTLTHITIRTRTRTLKQVLELVEEAGEDVEDDDGAVAAALGPQQMSAVAASKADSIVTSVYMLQVGGGLDDGSHSNMRPYSCILLSSRQIFFLVGNPRYRLFFSLLICNSWLFFSRFTRAKRTKKRPKMRHMLNIN